MKISIAVLVLMLSGCTVTPTYDKGTLICVASLAHPIKKEENDEYTFKVELDT